VFNVHLPYEDLKAPRGGNGAAIRGDISGSICPNGFANRTPSSIRPGVIVAVNGVTAMPVCMVAMHVDTDTSGGGPYGAVSNVGATGKAGVLLPWTCSRDRDGERSRWLERRAECGRLSWRSSASLVIDGRGRTFGSRKEAERCGGAERCKPRSVALRLGERESVAMLPGVRAVVGGHGAAVLCRTFIPRGATPPGCPETAVGEAEAEPIALDRCLQG